MSYCHECGSEVAKEDVYCPYCGIALQNPAEVSSTTVATPDAALAFEATQVDVPLESPIEPVREGEEVVIEDVSLPSIPKDFDTGAHSIDALLRSDASGNNALNSAAETFAADTPAAPAQPETDFSGENNRVADEKTGEPNFEAVPPPLPVVETTTEAAPQPGFGENVGGEIEPRPIENQTPDAQDFDSTIPYTPPDIAQQDATAPKLAENQEAALPQAQPESFPSSTAAQSVNEIQPPSTPLAENDEEDLPATLISEPLPPFEQNVPAGEAAPQNQPVAEPVPEKSDYRISEPSEKAAESSAEASGAEKSGDGAQGRSYTSPNVNSIDTGGKKAKLKTLSEGTVLNGRYEIVRKIGGGGMGAVYLASDKNLGGVLRAVKEMVQSYIEETQQEKAINDFKRESLLLTSLEHSSIPTIYDYFYDEKEGRFYLVMKYISGGDLAARLRSSPEGRIDEQSVTEWAIQVADVLDYLHNRQPPIVYRDLKPSNIMIDGNSGRVMLIDFGIARWVNKEEKGVTAVGTMGYAPPELFSGNVEARSDIYSLGSTMFHLLTGADPQNNPLLIFDFHKNPRPRQINPQLSDQIEQILMRSVEYNADKRFVSAGELRETLVRHLDNLKAGRLTYGLGDKQLVTAENEPVFCGFCGQKIVASDMFCPFCGAKQPLAQAAAASAQKPAFVAPPRLTARLYIVDTSELEPPTFNLEKDTSLIGRRDPMSNIFPEVDLSKFDPQTKISRRHARIWREGDKFMVEDLGSSNGTILLTKLSDPVRLLPQQPRALAHGDKLKLGDTTLHFVLG
ncbi:MAG TPA: protein kinase [Pyrinomonadaceae bacterium]|nr:protein kinase [Pyrinomonadaceae bacterium]